MRVREVFPSLAMLLSVASCVALVGGLVYLLCRGPGRVPDECQPLGRETEVYEDLKPGDRYVKGFPMMDQGRLPWCQIYTLARVLKHYGVEVSPEEAAQELQVDENRAPDVEDVKFLMDELCEDVGLRHVELMPEFQFDEEFKADYNRIASEKRKFGLSVCTSPQTNSQGRCTWMLDAGLLAMQIDLEILTEYWNRHRPERFELFMDAVVRSIKKNSPLVWSVVLGLVREDRLKNESAFHMRVIVGYNDKTDEILYSDSWGDRHRIKRMSVEDAYLITFRMWTYERKRKAAGNAD